MAQTTRSWTRARELLREEYGRAFRHDHWNIGLADAPISRFLEPDARPHVHWLPPPRPGSYRADPFGVARDGDVVIFFEDYDFESDKGVIAYACEGGAGECSPRGVALDLPVHASFPFVLEHDGSVYCVPETAAAREVALYRAVDFPSRWTKAVTILPGVAGVDPTIIEHEGRFWLLCTDLEDGAFSKLRIWHAPELLGPWTPHRGNPVKTDLRSARPGGTPFRVDGELYRPAQDCSSSYGGSLTINRIEELTEEAFSEEPVARLDPFCEGPYTRGVHTLSAVGNRTLIDGKWLAFNRSEMSRNFRESLRERWPSVLRGESRSRRAAR